MEDRKIATDSQASELFRAFVKSNRWTEAKALKARWKSLSKETTPAIRVEDEVSTEDLGYYSLSSDLSDLILRKFEYKNGMRILISGDCHFAIDAFKILNQKKDFSELMAQRGLVIGGTDYETIHQLRKQYSNFEIHITHNPSSWFKMGVDIFIMPSFTFFKDGKRTYSFNSVSSNLVGDFCRGLKSTGMKLPNSCQGQ